MTQRPTVTSTLVTAATQPARNSVGTQGDPRHPERISAMGAANGTSRSTVPVDDEKLSSTGSRGGYGSSGAASNGSTIAVPHSTRSSSRHTVAHPTTRVGRIPILNVTPVVDGGRWPAKSVIGEPVLVTATVFREGPDAVSVATITIDPDGAERARVPMPEEAMGTDTHRGWIVADREGLWGFRIEAWADLYGSWLTKARIKRDAGSDIDLMLEEGARIIERTRDALIAERALLNDGSSVPEGHPDDADLMTHAVTVMRDGGRSDEDRWAAGTSTELAGAVNRNPLREFLTTSATRTLLVQRPRALYSTWYEMFPRSEGAHLGADGRWVSGTLGQAAQRLDAIANMGFDIVYLPPVHPVGRINRKGPNNALTASTDDPGSPWAIGSHEGGHDAIHPSLGTEADFIAFTTRAHELGLEVALDLALQCAPDHPWAREHPAWFTTRADGSIAYAENPPKKYQDIYPVNFDNEPAALYDEILRIVELWIARGVSVFRVDNPHTKPVQFWEWLIAKVGEKHPEVLFLAEAFTRPAMMRTLAKIGFHQSYTYFTWRNTKQEIIDYAVELSQRSSPYLRPNLWTNTPDILPEYLQYSGPAGFKIRATLASTLSPSWGMYSGYELCEHVATQQGSEEYQDSEKYQYRPRDWASYEPGGSNEGRSISGYITALNTARKEHPALHYLRNIFFHATDDDHIVCYSRRLPPEHNNGVEDLIIVVVNLDPHGTRETTIHFTMPELGRHWHDHFTAMDVMTGESFDWSEHSYVRLDPHHQPAHVIYVNRP